MEETMDSGLKGASLKGWKQLKDTVLLHALNQASQNMAN